MHAMRHVRFFPFTFLSGVHGFAIFAPYLIAVVAVWVFRDRRRAQSLRLAPVPVPVSTPPSTEH